MDLYVIVQLDSYTFRWNKYCPVTYVNTIEQAMEIIKIMKFQPILIETCDGREPEWVALAEENHGLPPEKVNWFV